MTPGVKPLGDMVTIKPIYAERVQTAGMDIDVRMTAGGVALPDSVDNSPIYGVVVALGDGYIEGCSKCQPNGTHHVFALTVGDEILFPPWKCTSVILDDEEYFLIAERDVCGIRVTG